MASVGVAQRQLDDWIRENSVESKLKLKECARGPDGWHRRISHRIQIAKTEKMEYTKAIWCGVKRHWNLLNANNEIALFNLFFTRRASFRISLAAARNRIACAWDDDSFGCLHSNRSVRMCREPTTFATLNIILFVLLLVPRFERVHCAESSEERRETKKRCGYTAAANSSSIGRPGARRTHRRVISFLFTFWIFQI